MTRLRQSAKDSADRHPSPLTAEQLDIVQVPKADLFVVVGELLYRPDSSNGAPKSNPRTLDSSNDEQQEDEKEEGPTVWASHLICTKVRSERCNLFALVSDEEGGRKSWTFLSLPQSGNDWVVYYPEFTGYPDALQDSQHKRRRAVWKQRIAAFCALFLATGNGKDGGDKTSAAVRGAEEVSVPETSSAVVGGQTTSSHVEPAEHARVFQLTRRLLYPSGPNGGGIDEYGVQEITETCQVSSCCPDHDIHFFFSFHGSRSLQLPGPFLP